MPNSVDVIANPIPVAAPWITEREVQYVADAARNAWGPHANDFHERFEHAFAERHGKRFAIALPSCTSAIHLSLLALGIGPGDEVVVPECTWIATVAPVVHVGATPVFVDIDPTTWCLSVPALQSALSPKTKAVIPVDLYGGMPDYPALLRTAIDANIAVIEDAAEAIGSSLQGKPSGAWGTTGVFSFHGSKTLTTYEGGMLVTDDDKLYHRVLFLRDHGREPGDRSFVNREVGWKYKMSSMQAAMGLAQLERLDEIVARKRSIFAAYTDRLAGMPELTLNAEPTGVCNSYWMVTLVADAATGLNAATMMSYLGNLGVDTRPFFHPLSSLPAFRDTDVPHRRHEAPVAASISLRAINLPSGPALEEASIDKVCDALRAMLRGSARLEGDRALGVPGVGGP